MYEVGLNILVSNKCVKIYGFYKIISIHYTRNLNKDFDQTVNMSKNIIYIIIVNLLKVNICASANEGVVNFYTQTEN